MDIKKLIAVCVFAAGGVLFAGEGQKDMPFEVDGKIADVFEETIASRISHAQKTLPLVKKKFARGLSEGDKLFLTVRVADDNGRVEQVFVEVYTWNKSSIGGKIANDLHHVTGYVKGQNFSFSEGDVLDWTVRKSDGTEEGNFVGKFVEDWLGGSTAES